MNPLSIRRITAFVKLFLLSMALAVFLLPGTVFIHEATHYFLYSSEGITVTSFHVLDADSFRQGRYGFITTTHESKYGNVFQESAAYFTSYFFFSCGLLFCLLKPCKYFTITQLEKMGVQNKNSSIQRKKMKN